MAKKIMQFRYYGENHSNNQPKNISKATLGKQTAEIASIFQGYLPITQLGIQTLPGTRVYLNNNEVGPIIIGSTGIYELELEGISEITDIYFDSTSLELIDNNDNAYLIIDIIYDV